MSKKSKPTFDEKDVLWKRTDPFGVIEFYVADGDEIRVWYEYPGDRSMERGGRIAAWACDLIRQHVALQARIRELQKGKL